jgi:hypothetical protein
LFSEQESPTQTMLSDFNIQGSILLAAVTLLANILSAQFVDESTTATTDGMTTTIHQQNDTSNGNMNAFLRGWFTFFSKNLLKFPTFLAELMGARDVGRNWLLILLVTVGPAIAFLLAVGLVSPFSLPLLIIIITPLFKPDYTLHLHQEPSKKECI